MTNVNPPPVGSVPLAWTRVNWVVNSTMLKRELVKILPASNGPPSVSRATEPVNEAKPLLVRSP
jgi:hypothetical protein